MPQGSKPPIYTHDHISIAPPIKSLINPIYQIHPAGRFESATLQFLADGYDIDDAFTRLADEDHRKSRLSSTL